MAPDRQFRNDEVLTLMQLQKNVLQIQIPHLDLRAVFTSNSRDIGVTEIFHPDHRLIPVDAPAQHSIHRKTLWQCMQEPLSRAAASRGP